MNKTELIEHIAKTADISKAAAARSLDAVMDAITETLKNNGSVTLVGFGTFSVGERAARSGRNPRTGEEIKIKSARIPKFKAGKLLKDAVMLLSTARKNVVKFRKKEVENFSGNFEKSSL